MAYAPRVTRAHTAVLARPYLGSLRFIALSSLGVLVAHDAVFVAQYGLGAGYDAAMARTAHGYWPAFILLTLLVGAASAVTALRAITHLARLVRGLPPDNPTVGRPAYWSEVRHLWPRLFAVVVVGFLVQENIEHVTSGNGLPGLWALSAPDYPLAIPAILVVTGLLAAAGAWIQWRREDLIERLRAANAAVLRQRHHAARAPHDRWALLAALLVHRWTLLRRDAERAPPLAGAA